MKLTEQEIEVIIPALNKVLPINDYHCTMLERCKQKLKAELRKVRKESKK